MTSRLRLAPKVPTRAAKGPCWVNFPDSTLSSMAASGSAYMGASDAFSWRMERDPALRSTVVAVVWLDRRPEWDVLVGRVDRLSRVMPSLRQHVVEPPFRLAGPRWTCDPDFDLSWHVCRVTVPGSRIRDAVLELARRSATEPFDRNRPLWRLTLVEGIKDGAAALIIKFHHSLSDGVGGMRALAILADLQREPADLGEMPPAPSGETLDSLALVTDALTETARNYVRVAWRGTGAAIPALIRYARDPIGQAWGAAAMARSVYRTAAPSASTLSPVMRERATERRLAMIEVPLDDLKQAAKTVGVTVNDAYLAAVTGGLRRYHEHHGQPVESLRVVMPISLRAGPEPDWGNKITLLRLVVPARGAGPGHPDAPGAPRGAGGARGAVAPGHRRDRRGPQPAAGRLRGRDPQARRLPGQQRARHARAGLRRRQQGHGLLRLRAHHRHRPEHHPVLLRRPLPIGINIDTAAVPDPDLMLACLREGFAEITAVAEDVATAA